MSISFEYVKESDARSTRGSLLPTIAAALLVGLLVTIYLSGRGILPTSIGSYLRPAILAIVVYAIWAMTRGNKVRELRIAELTYTVTLDQKGVSMHRLAEPQSQVFVPIEDLLLVKVTKNQEFRSSYLGRFGPIIHLGLIVTGKDNFKINISELDHNLIEDVVNLARGAQVRVENTSLLSKD